MNRIHPKKVSPPTQAQREHFAAMSDREIARLLGRRAQMALSRRARGKRSHASNRWQEWELKFLGTMPDSAVAKKIGRTTEAVKSCRQARSILPFRRQRRWMAAEDKVLQKYSRKEAAQRLGRPLHALEYRLRQLRSGAPLRSPRPWTKKEQAQLGKHSDTVVARRLRRSFNSVRWKRKQRGIPCHGDPGRPWTRQEEELLGTMPDMEAARKINRSYDSVFVHRVKLGIPVVLTHRPWTPEEEALLGTLPDAELARKIGRSRELVGIRRRKSGLPFVLGKNHGGFNRTWHKWERWEAKLLGGQPDKDVARRLERSVGAVKAMRAQLRIPSATPVRVWTEEENRLLGTMPDAELARRLKRGITGVRQQRLKLGISFRRPRHLTSRTQ